MRGLRLSRSVLMSWTVLVALIACGISVGAAEADASMQGGLAATLQEPLAGLPPQSVPTGILLDRVLPLVDPAPYDGSPGAPAITPSEWRQLYGELFRAALEKPAGPPLAEIEARKREGVVDLGLMNIRYDRLRADAATASSGLQDSG